MAIDPNLYAIGAKRMMNNPAAKTVVLNTPSAVTNDPKVTSYYPAGDMLIRKEWVLSNPKNYNLSSGGISKIIYSPRTRIPMPYERQWEVHEQRIDDHYIHNGSKTIPASAIDSGGKIVVQDDMFDFLYGSKTLDYNGCGIIAVYNASLIMSNVTLDLADVIKTFEEESIIPFRGSVLDGRAGSYPWSISWYLKKYLGYKTEDKFIDAYIPKYTYDPYECREVFTLDYDKEYAIEEWSNRAKNCRCGAIMYMSNEILNGGHFVCYERNGTQDALGEDEYIFYNDRIESKDVEDKDEKLISSSSVGTLREFISQTTLPFYHIAINK